MKIPTEDFTDETLAIHDTYGNDIREIMVLVMDVDKVADEMTNTVAEIPNEDFSDMTRVLWRLLIHIADDVSDGDRGGGC